MEGDYKCNKCNTWSVTMEGSFERPGNSYQEVWYHNYYCSECDAECSIQKTEDSYTEGDMIDF